MFRIQGTYRQGGMLTINFEVESHVGTMKQDVFYIFANPTKGHCLQEVQNHWLQTYT